MLIVIRAILIFSLLFPVTLIGLLYFLIRPFDSTGLYIFVRIVGKSSLKLLGLRVNLVNGELLNKEQPCVFISNHLENLDFFIFCSCAPKRTISIGKKSILYIPLFGPLYWLTGNILINRQSKRKSYQSIVQAANTINDKKKSILIFPEGTRSKKRGLLRFKKGPFSLAIRAKVPIVPICISSYNRNLSLNSWKSGTVTVKVLPSIQTTNLKNEEALDLSCRCHEMMKQEISLLDSNHR